MPKNILDYIEKEQIYPPRINIFDIPQNNTKFSILKWGIYICITLIFITYLYIDTPNHRKMDILLGLCIAFFVAFPLLAKIFLNFLFNGFLFLFHWLFIVRIKNIQIHIIYSKIYFTTPTSLIFFLFLFIFFILT